MARPTIQVDPKWRSSTSNPTICFYSLLLNLEKWNFLGIDIYKIFMLYYKQEKKQPQRSLPTRAASAFPASALSQKLPPNIPSVDLDEEPGI